MKKLFLSSLIASTLVLFLSCGGLGTGKYDIKADGFEKMVSDIKKSVGENGMIDEITLSFDAKNPEKNTEIEVANIDFQSKEDKMKLQRLTYVCHTGWGTPEPLEIRLTSGDAEDFKLEDELNSVNQISVDALKKVYTESIKKVSEECDKHVFSLIQMEFEKGKDIIYEVSMKGNLKSNGVQKSYNFDFDKDGNLIQK